MAAAQQTVDTLTIRGQSQGLDKLASDLNKVTAAQDKLTQSSAETAKVTETTGKRQLSLENAYKRLAASIDPAYAAQQRLARGMQVLDAMKDRGLADPEYQQRVAQLQARYAALGVANDNLVGKTGSLVGQTGNLAAQFQDIAVQLQGGASPFTIALQQGTQIAAVLGETGGGARGAVKALGAAFLSVISPVSLLTIGAIAAGGAMIQYFTGAGEKVEGLDDRLKAHTDLIRSIKDAYGEAAEGLDKLTAESGAVLEQQLRARMETLKGDIQRLWSDLYAQISKPTGAAITDALGNVITGSGETTLDPKFEAFRQAIDRLSASAADGVPGIRVFREEVARIMDESGNTGKIAELGRELLKNSEAALKVEDALQQAEKAIRLTTGAAGQGAGDLKEFEAALKSLGQIGLPDFTAQQKALQEYRRAVGALSDDDFEGRNRARRAYDEAVGRANQRDVEKAAEEAAKTAEQDAKRQEQTWARAVDRIQDQTRALEQQAVTYGQSAGEIARYRAEQELLNAATETGRDLTPDLRAQIAAMADQAGVAAQRMEDLQSAIDWSDMTGDALKGFISDLRSGKDAGEAFLNVMEKIADKLLDMSIDWMLGKGPNPFSSVMGAFSGVGAEPSATAAPGASGGGVAAFSGLGKLPEVITSAVSPLKEAANSVADVARYATGGLRAQVETYVRDGALSRGMDPDIIAKGIKQESGFNPFALGDSGKSYGVMQLYTGGGLGNEALKRGISLDPSNWKEQVDFGLDYMKKNGHGQWYGFRDSGVRDPWAGIDRNGPQAFNGSAGNDNLIGGMGDDMRSLSGDFDQLSQSMSNTTPQITQGLTGLTNITQQGGQSIGGALKDTASTIGEGANGVGGAIQQLMQALSKSGGGSLSGLMGLFSKGGGDWSDTNSWTIGNAMEGVTFPVPGNHTGGLVGRDRTFTRMVSSSLFHDAPRYHDGLRPDEVPSILQKGEWVLSRDDVAAIKSGGKGGTGAGGVVINPTVINNTGAEVKTETRQNEDGSIDIMTIIDERAKGAVRKDARRNGPLSRELGAGFNGRG